MFAYPHSGICPGIFAADHATRNVAAIPQTSFQVNGNRLPVPEPGGRKHGIADIVGGAFQGHRPDLQMDDQANPHAGRG